MQRIQTLYLLAATALMGIFMISPLAVFSNETGIYTMSMSSISSVDGSVVSSLIYLMIITILATILPFVNIFLFKKRMLQLRLCVVQIVLALGVLAVGGVYYYLSNRAFGAEVGGESALRIVCALPLVSAIFDYLALRGIFKDELLIRSLDRIR